MNGEISVIRLRGYLDVITSEELDAAITHLLETKQYRIIVDLNDVDYISSMGWSVFLSKIQDFRYHDGDLKLAQMQLNVYEVFKILEFDLFLHTYPTIAAAVSAFNLNGRAVHTT